MRHDPAARRQGKRKGRERGAWIYVTESQLNEMGFATKIELGSGVPPVIPPPPYYRTWTRRKTILVQFYREP